MGWIIFIIVVFVLFLIGKSKSVENETNEGSTSNVSKVNSEQYQSTSNISKVNSEQYHSTVRFRYKDGEGNETERTVDVITGRKGDQFRAYCRIRKESRNFYFKRIQNYKVIDVNTGEVLTPMEWRFQLQGTKVAETELKREKKHMQSIGK